MFVYELLRVTLAAAAAVAAAAVAAAEFLSWINRFNVAATVAEE